VQNFNPYITMMQSTGAMREMSSGLLEFDDYKQADCISFFSPISAVSRGAWQQ
jgi:hypothetical protein